MGEISNHYGKVDELTGETNRQVTRLREEIIPDVKNRWNETVATFQGDGADQFGVITKEFHARMSALEESLKNLNSKVIEIAASGGSVQQTDSAIARLFQ
ncbi:hypothetical protein [Nocardia sp. NPDC024068]|uniref:hypothetical protein n=1 Tax=Nocardia sp. NPDC024068 TaxID=3157197 RepID=UPI0033E7D308